MTPQQIDQHVGRVIRARRHSLGQSQKDLANACVLTFQQIQKYETGKNRVSASKLVQIAEAQATPIAFYFEGITQAKSLIDQETDEVISIARRLIAFPRDARDSLVRLIDALEKNHV